MSAWTQFRDSALDGLGFGSGKETAQTLGNVARDIIAPGAPSPYPQNTIAEPVTQSQTLPTVAGIPLTTVALIVLGAFVLFRGK